MIIGQFKIEKPFSKINTSPSNNSKLNIVSANREAGRQFDSNLIMTKISEVMEETLKQSARQSILPFKPKKAIAQKAVKKTVKNSVKKLIPNPRPAKPMIRKEYQFPKRINFDNNLRESAKIGMIMAPRKDHPKARAIYNEGVNLTSQEQHFRNTLRASDNYKPNPWKR